jgi:cytochrome c2
LHVNKFFVSASAVNLAGIYQIDYSLSDDRLLGIPKPILRYRGEGKQRIAAMAIGQDGVYFAPLLGSNEGNWSIYRLSYSPGENHPFGIDSLTSATQILKEKNCWACHSLNGSGGEVGPNLDYLDLIERLSNRLNSNEYVTQLDAIDMLQVEPFVSFIEERDEIRNLEGSDLLESWMVSHLIEPKFDNPGAQMPNLGLTKDQAKSITSFLLTPPETESLTDLVSEFLYDYIFDLSHLAAFTFGGFVLFILVRKFPRFDPRKSR